MMSIGSPEFIAYAQGFVEGAEEERARILSLWEAEMSCPCDEPMQHLVAHIKRENNA